MADERQEQTLGQQLMHYAKSDFYPYHMPGHKRNLTKALEGAGASEQVLEAAAGMDITEIDGFDNLHEPEEILKRAMQRAARLYGARNAFYSVNGATGMLLTAISAAVPEGGRLIMARNCHKAVYHAVYLRHLEPVYLYPETIPGLGIAGAVTAGQVEEALLHNPDAAAVLITSPSYDGITADVEQIAALAHRYGKPLLVDAAHGAHFGFHPDFPESPVRLGADLTVVSLHKTMPCLTQTALLLTQGQLVSTERLRLFEGMYQTSSPSYVLMAAMDACMAAVEEKGSALWDDFFRWYREFLERTKGLGCLQVITGGRIPTENGASVNGILMDSGKILLKSLKTCLTGKRFYDILLKQYHLQMEMAAGDCVTAIMTCCDKKEGWERLADALCEIDRRLAAQEDGRQPGQATEPERRPGQATEPDRRPGQAAQPKRLPAGQKPQPRLTAVCSLTAALDAPKEKIPISEATGRIAGSFVNLYPPGIPIAVPGERLEEDTVQLFIRYRQQQLPLQGICEDAITVLKSPV